jgi:hypothetical protein
MAKIVINDIKEFRKEQRRIIEEEKKKVSLVEKPVKIERTDQTITIVKPNQPKNNNFQLPLQNPLRQSNLRN